MNLSKILSQTALIIGVLFFSAGLQTLAVFTPPTTTPPNADAYAPLTTSPTVQAKVGGLLLNTGSAINGLLIPNGNVGIGTLNPTAKLDVVGAVKVGTAAAVICDATSSGQQRYNSTSNVMEYCNGTTWTSMGGGTGGGFTSCRTISRAGSASCPAGETMTGASCRGVDTCSGSDSSAYGGSLTNTGITCANHGCTTHTAYVRCCM